MSGYSDEKLLNVYKNKSDYNEEAIEAMEMVIRERGLQSEAIKVESEKRAEDELSYEELLKKFQFEEFGKVVSDKEYAQQLFKDDIYFHRYISPLSHYGWINPVFIIIGITGLFSFMTLLVMGEFKNEFLLILILSFFLAMLLPLGIWKTRKNKTELSIIKDKNSIKLSIGNSKDIKNISFPFKYECYWEWHYIKRNFKQIKLIIYIYDDLNDEMIIYHELLSPLKKPAPHWEEIPKNLHHQYKGKSIYVYTNYGFQAPFLYSFQKLLKGLHTQ